MNRLLRDAVAFSYAPVNHRLRRRGYSPCIGVAVGGSKFIQLLVYDRSIYLPLRRQEGKVSCLQNIGLFGRPERAIKLSAVFVFTFLLVFLFFVCVVFGYGVKISDIGALAVFTLKRTTSNSTIAVANSKIHPLPFMAENRF